jgi:hypothetical protein
MKSDMFLGTPQPPYVWKLATSILVGISLYIFISHNYHFILYVVSFLSFLVGIVDMIFKWIEVHNLRMSKKKVVWFSHKFLRESGFLSLGLAAALLFWELVLKGYDVLVLIFGFPAFIGLLYMAIVELRALTVVFQVKTVEDSNKDKIEP